MVPRRVPALFLSQGSPMLAIVDSAARRFLSGLGARLRRPCAVVVLSAHNDTGRVEITSGARPATIHDFGGFPRELYELRYPAPGAPELAVRIRALLAASGIDAALEPKRGFDHGAWISLQLMYSAADLPLVQVSIDSTRDAEWHFTLGRALRPLRDGTGRACRARGSRNRAACRIAGAVRSRKKKRRASGPAVARIASKVG